MFSKMKSMMYVCWCMLRAHVLKFWIWTSKIMPDLWLVDLFCPIKKYFHTPPYYGWMLSPVANEEIFQTIPANEEEGHYPKWPMREWKLSPV